jgi:hypothetical protein
VIPFACCNCCVRTDTGVWIACPAFPYIGINLAVRGKPYGITTTAISIKDAGRLQGLGLDPGLKGAAGHYGGRYLTQIYIVVNTIESSANLQWTT